MNTYTNEKNLPLAIAVWLANNTYEKAEGISVTSLMKPVRQIVLIQRLPENSLATDISTVVKSRKGTAIHDAIEKAWKSDNLLDILMSLGISEKQAKRVVVNPKPEDLKGPVYPIYLENRMSKEILGYRINGQYDFIDNGTLQDFKNTSVFSYTSGKKDDDYILQGSLYRWLNPEIITEEFMQIIFILDDWSMNRSLATAGYPKSDVIAKQYKLLPLEATEQYVRNKIAEIERYKNVPEPEIPLCNDEDLWRSKDTYKYYKNPLATGRSTRTSEDYDEVFAAFVKDGRVGRIDTVKGKVQACRYCPAFSLCSQKDYLIEAGELTL